MKYLFVIISCFILFSCKTEQEKTPTLPSVITKRKDLKYAKGFSIINYGNYKILTIESPWPNSDTSYKYVLISEENAAKTTFPKDAFNDIIITPIQKAVVTSTTHIPALDLLNVEETLIGFPGTDYISTKSVRTLIEEGKIKDIGQNESINTELVLSLKPNVVVAFGVDGKSKALNTVNKANIPVIYNGDWVEASPLAKAEWIKFFGALYQKERKADSIFNVIENNYIKAKNSIKNITKKPTVLSGAMSGDTWYLPSGTSTEAQILKDANVNYLWQDTNSKGSLKLNFETVYQKAKDAEFWLSPSYYKNYAQLLDANSHYEQFKAFKTKNIYSFNNTLGETGGALYYELGIARPDLVLKDIIKICHPNQLPDYQPFFFKPFN